MPALKTTYLILRKNKSNLYWRTADETVKKVLTLCQQPFVTERTASKDCVSALCCAPKHLSFAKELPTTILAFMDPKDIDYVSRDEKPLISGLKNFKKAAQIVVQTPEQAHFLKAAGIDDVPLHIIPFCVPHDLRQETPAIEKPAFLRHYNLNPDKTLCLVMGLYQDSEGMDEIESLARILPAAQFVFFGIRSKSPKVAEKFNRRGKLPNLTYIEELRTEFYRSALANADLLIVANPWLGNPFLIQDAIYSNIPVVSLRLSLLASILQPDIDYLPYKGGVSALYEVYKAALSDKGQDLTRAARERLDKLAARQDYQKLAKLLLQLQ